VVMPIFIVLAFCTYGDVLMSEGDYFRAITEYKRMLFWGYIDSQYAYHNIGKCYSRLQNYEKAMKYYRYAVVRGKKDTVPEILSLDLAYALIRNGNVAAPRLILQSMKSQQAYELYATTFILEGDVRKGCDLLRNRGFPCQYTNPADRALLSAFIPGSGQVLSGHVSEGLVSFLLNMGFCYLTYKSIRARDYPAAALFSSFLLRFYYGNVTMSFRYVQEKNSEQLKETWQKYD